MQSTIIFNGFLRFFVCGILPNILFTKHRENVEYAMFDSLENNLEIYAAVGSVSFVIYQQETNIANRERDEGEDNFMRFYQAFRQLHYQLW